LSVGTSLGHVTSCPATMFASEGENKSRTHTILHSYMGEEGTLLHNATGDWCGDGASKNLLDSTWSLSSQSLELRQQQLKLQCTQPPIWIYLGHQIVQCEALNFFWKRPA
jgi:hypothetical protein